MEVWSLNVEDKIAVLAFLTEYFFFSVLHLDMIGST